MVLAKQWSRINSDWIAAVLASNPTHSHLNPKRIQYFTPSQHSQKWNQTNISCVNLPSIEVFIYEQ